MCITCQKSSKGKGKSNECCCYGCSEACHAGHKVKMIAYGAAYCDCGQKGDDHCKIIKQSTAKHSLPSAIQLQSSPAPICSFHSINFNSIIVQDLLASQCRELVRHSKETFWLGRDDEPQCLLEHLARTIYKYHASSVGAECLGAEWWVQVKQDAPLSHSSGIDLHYDKDERIAELFQLGFFPLISSVTYLTQSTGEEPQIPTIVLKTTAVDPIESTPIREVYVSYPRVGKHVAFKGDLLHGAPRQWIHPDDEYDEEQADGPDTSLVEGSAVRITFLVNIWSTHRPADVARLPETIRTLMQPAPDSTSIELTPWKEGVPSQEVQQVSVTMEEAMASDEVAGKYVNIPFISDKASWGKDEDEQGLYCLAYVPERSKEKGAIASLSGSYAITYAHDDCAASLQYEEDEEEDGEEVDNEE